jgi:nicotinamide-nucleotide amidase
LSDSSGLLAEASHDASAVLDLLARRRETLAVAESLTGGLLAATIVAVPGASVVFRGGVVVYATDLKARLAGVPEDLLAARGPVDPQVAQAMADGVRIACSADWGLATTGVAGPDAQGGVAVGTVFLGLSGPAGRRHTRRLALTGDRGQIRRAAVTVALQLLYETADDGGARGVDRR